MGLSGGICFGGVWVFVFVWYLVELVEGVLGFCCFVVCWCGMGLDLVFGGFWGGGI